MVSAAGAARHVVELGAGTGPVTHAVMRLLPQASLVAVELQPALVTHLRKRFPVADIREACAQAVLDESGYPANEAVAVISSLPFRSLPAEVVHNVIDSITRFLSRHPGSCLVQFTYQPRAPFTAPLGFYWTRADWVWRNTPPAGVWVLRAQL